MSAGHSFGIASQLLGSGVDPVRLTALLLLFAVIALFVAVRSGESVGISRRRIESLDRQSRITAEVAEADGWQHFTVGSAQLGGSLTIGSLVGLSALRVADEAAEAVDVPSHFTTGDPLTYFLAQGALGATTELLALDPAAYVAAAMDLVEREEPRANFMFGALDDSYLLVAMRARQVGAEQVVGSTVLSGVPMLAVVAENTGVGEEACATALEAAEASVGVRSLDLVRWAVVLTAVGLLSARLVGIN